MVNPSTKCNLISERLALSTHHLSDHLALSAHHLSSHLNLLLSRKREAGCPRACPERSRMGLAFETWDSTNLNRGAFLVPGPCFSRPLVHPIVHRLPPELRVLRLQHPVSLVRKVKHLARHLQPLQRVEQLEPLTHIEPVIKLSVNHQRRRLEVGRIHHWRPFAEGILAIRLPVVVPRMPVELPLVEPHFFGRP